MLMYYFVLRGICLSTFSHDAVHILASPESTVRGCALCKTGELVIHKLIKGPYADHIRIPQGSTGSSTIFDIKWKPIFFWLQIQHLCSKLFVVLEIWQKM